MIVTCPQCNTSFNMPASAIPAEGRKVRCSHCQEIWRQPAPELDTDENNVTDEQQVEDVDFTDIIESVDALAQQVEDELEADQELDQGGATDPQEVDELEDESAEETDAEANEDEDTSLSAPEEAEPESGEESDETEEGIEFPAMVVKIEDNQQDGGDATKKSGGLPKAQILVGVSVFVLTALVIMIGLIMLRSTLVQAWPVMNGFYGVLGFEKQVKGSEVVFNELHASVDQDHHTLTLSGELVNLSSHDAVVLPMQAKQIDEHGEILKSWVIMPPVKSLPAGGSSVFESEYGLLENATSVEIGFTLIDLPSQETHAEESEAPTADHDGHDSHEPKPDHDDEKSTHHEPTAHHEPTQHEPAHH